MVRETRYLWVGNLPEKITKERIEEHFQRCVCVPRFEFGFYLVLQMGYQADLLLARLDILVVGNRFDVLKAALYVVTGASAILVS